MRRLSSKLRQRLWNERRKRRLVLGNIEKLQARRREGEPGARCSSCTGMGWDGGVKAVVSSTAHLSVDRAHLLWARGAGTAQPSPPHAALKPTCFFGFETQ